MTVASAMDDDMLIGSGSNAFIMIDDYTMVRISSIKGMVLHAKELLVFSYNDPDPWVSHFSTREEAIERHKRIRTCLHRYLSNDA